MRYDDASNAGSMAADTAPIARADVDQVTAGSFDAATGNIISGSGTVSGSAGADTVGDAPGKIIEVHGAGGPTTVAGDNFQAAGQYGHLSMDVQGNFNYVRNAGTPEGVQDVFGYTLADRDGATSSTTLTIDVGQSQAQAQAALADGAVVLPAGIELSDIHVNGRDLVINMPDGTQMVIPGGAVFVPNLVIGDVEVPPSNLAALLIDSEPKPAASPLQSSGGNFAVDVPPLDPGVPLGDLIPPTELGYTPPDFEEVTPFEDEEPSVVIIPDGQPAAVAASDEVDESGLAERTGEPEGTLEPQDIESTSGVISIDSGDGVDSVTINGVEVTAENQVIHGERGDLLITSINLATGQIGYTYTVTDNTIEGVDDFDDFSVVITDDDGDTASATLHIDILDDGPIARDDTDSVAEEASSTIGNVITGAGTTSGNAGSDTAGADGIDGETNDSVDGVTGIHAGTTGAFTTVPQNGGGVVVHGQFGDLEIHVDGSYTYTKFADVGAGGTDVFTYQITDGDGTTDEATLTIGVPATPNDTPEILRVEDTLVDEDGLDGANLDGTPLRPGETDSTESDTDSGQILVDYKGDVPANLMNAITLVDSPALDGQLHATNGDPITFTLEGGELVGRANGVGDPLVIISITGAVAGSGGQVTYTYQVELLGPVEHPDPGSEDSIQLTGVDFQITDSNGDHASGEFNVTIVDDLPTAREPEPDPEHPNDPPPPLVSGNVDEDDLPEGNNDVVDSSDDLPINSPTTASGAAGSLAALFNAGADSPLQNFGLVDDTSGLPALTSDHHAVLYDIDAEAGTLTAYADLDNDGIINDGDGSKVFTLTVGEDGSWSFELQGQLDHPVEDTEDNLELDLSSIVTAEDADGDPVTAADGAFVINVDDDMPTARVPEPDPEHPNDPPEPLILGRVDEDDLSEANGDNSNGNNDHLDGDEEPIDASGDSDATTTGGAAGSLDALFNAGADRPLTYTLSDNTAALEAQNLSSNGHDLLYVANVETGVLTAYADLDDNGDLSESETAETNVVFTLTVGEDGSWSFNLQDQIDHSVPGTEDNVLIDLGSVVVATDADGDSVPGAPGAFVVDVDDDMPKPFDDPNDPEDDVCPDDVIVVNSDDSHFHGSLNLPPVGADDPGKAFFNIADGTAVVDGEGHPITAEGQPLFYFVNAVTGVLEAHEGNSAAGPLVFTITLNPDGTFDYDQLIDISSTTTLHLSEFDAVGGGNVDAKAVDIPDSQFDLMVSTKDGDSVNTNNTTFGVSDGQSFEAGELIRFDLVQNAFTTGSGGGAVVNYGDYYTANGFQQDVSGLAGDQTASFTVKAIVAVTSGAEPGADGDGEFYNDGNDTVVAVTQLNLYDAAGVLVDPGDYAGLGITVTDLGGGVWQVVGLPNAYDYEITSDTAFNAVQVEAIEGTGTFKLGAIDITTTTETSVDFSVPVTFTDADGDPVVCDIDIILGAPTNTPDVSAQVNEAALDSVGSNPGSDSETTGGDLGAIVSGGSGTTTFALAGDADHDGIIVGTHGTITLNQATGEWTYTLTSPVDSSPDADDSTNVEPAVESFTYEMIQGGNVVGTGTITVDVKDDVPTAENDTDVIDEGDISESGNVMSGVGTTSGNAGDDTPGADGAEVTAASFGVALGTADEDGNITIAGQWGTLVIEPDGDYTYTLSPSGTTALNALGAGQTLAAEVFNYTLTDGDGDEESATLTITPTGANDNPGVNVPDTGDDTKTVYEAGLAAGPDRPGEPAGTAEAADGTSTDNDVATETVTGSFTFTAGDGATTITIQGSGAAIPVPLAGPFTPIVGDYGTLTITSIVGNTVNYSYTLADNINHNDANPDQDDFTIVVDDSDATNADQATDTLTIHIADDTPIADNDTDVIDEGDLSETGNVISGVGTTSGSAGDDRVGADNATVTAASFGVTPGVADGDGNITIAGQWGTLVIEPDGDYTYTLSSAGTTALNALGAGQTLAAEVFTYTLKDSDNSSDTATLTITPTGANDSPGVLVPDTGDNTKTVYEAALAAGPSRPGEPAGTAEAADGTSTDNDVTTETVTGSFTFTAGDGATTITIQGSGAAIPVPLAGPFTPIVGDYGTLTITSIVGNTVNYSYTLADNINHNDANPDQDDFTIVVDDSDGNNADAASDILTIHIADDTPIADDDTDVIDEGDLSEIGNVITGTGTTSGAAGDDRVGADNATVTAASHPTGGVGTVGGGGNITVVGQWGTLVIEPDGDYTYTLSPAGTTALNALGNNQTLAAEVFTYTLKDGDNSSDTATLTITPKGSNDNPGLNVPDTGDDTKTVDEAGLPTRTGELAGTGEAADAIANNDNSEIVSGSFTFTAGDGATVLTIDGAGAGGPVTIPLAGPFTPIVGAYGTLTITSIVGNTVNYTYTLTDNVDHDSQTPQDDFTITVDDSDGDPADKVTDTLTIHITDDTPLNYQPDTAILENSGTDTFTGKLDDDDTLDNDGGADSIASLVWNTGIAGTVLLNTDGDPVTVNGQSVKLYIQPDGSLKATTDNSNSAMTVFTATLNAGTSSYTIDFDRPLDNGSTSASDFTGAKAGNNAWIGIDPNLVNGLAIDIAAANDPNPDSVDLLITGFDHSSHAATTVNRDSDDIGAGTGQANDPDETLRIDFVQDLRRDAGVDESTAGGYNFDNHVGQKVFSFTMVDPKAGGDTAVLLEAYNVIDEAASKADVSATANQDQVDIDPASIVVKVGTTTLVAGDDYEVYPDGNGGVYISPIPAGAVITFQALGGATFEAVEVTNAAGHDIPGATPGNFAGADFAIGGFSYGANDPGDPVEFNLPTLLTDGDGDTSSGTVGVTVYPVGQEPAHALAALTAETSFAKSSLDTSSLMATNDNSTQQKLASSTNNTVLTAALAAAGLSAEPLAASTTETHGKGGKQSADSVETQASTADADDGDAHADRGSRSEQRSVEKAEDAADQSRHGSHDDANSEASVSADHAQVQAPMELLQGTETPSHGEADAPAQITAAAIVMPSAEQLAAADTSATEGKSASVDGSVGELHNDVVGKVLADALNGGGDGPNLDALINALPGGGHGGKGLAALASHGHGAVSNGDTADFAGFTGGHGMHTMDHMAMHQDAAPAHG